MIDRCSNADNPDYANYGARGITVCDRWLASFAAFWEDMGPRPSPAHSIERRDNDGPYTRDNCVWADRQAQNSNKRNNRSITFGGRTQTLSQWARELGISRATLDQRLARWTLQEALTRPGDTSRNRWRSRNP